MSNNSQLIRSAIRASQQPTSPIGFLFLNFRHRLVRDYWYYIILHYVIFCKIISYDFKLHYVILTLIYYISLCYIISYYIMLYCIKLYYIILYYTKSCYIVLYFNILYYITLFCILSYFTIFYFVLFYFTIV